MKALAAMVKAVRDKETLAIKARATTRTTVEPVARELMVRVARALRPKGVRLRVTAVPAPREPADPAPEAEEEPSES